MDGGPRQDEDLDACPMEFLIDRVQELQERKIGLLTAIKREAHEHDQAVAVLQRQIARLKDGEQELLSQHRRATQLRKDRQAVSTRVYQHHQPLPQPAAVYTQAAPPPPILPVGTEVRVRDTPAEDWKYGTIDGYSGTTPLVRLKGWEKLLTWKYLEVKP